LLAEIHPSTGKSGAMSRANKQLVEYGIKDETTEYRAHVCPVAGRVYAFETRNGLSAIERHDFDKKEVYTPCRKCRGSIFCDVCFGKGKVLTALGFIVPVLMIPEIMDIGIPDSWCEEIGLEVSLSPEEKGRKAVSIITGLIKRGKFPFLASQKLITDRDIQINGTDIQVKLILSIQVKCDFRGGSTELGGTGNLFIQTHESNPFKLY